MAESTVVCRKKVPMKTGYVQEFSSDEDASKFISDEESRTCRKYKAPETVQNFHDNTGCRICWDDVNNVSGFGSSLSYDGIPFIILKNEEMPCIQGPCKGNRKRKSMSDDDHDYGVPAETTCTAQVKICKIIKFPQFKNKGKDTKSIRTILSGKLKELFKEETTVKEYKVLVRMPVEDEHNHIPQLRVETEGSVKIPFNDLLKSLPENLFESGMKKQELTMVQGAKYKVMTIAGAQEEVVQQCDPVIIQVPYTEGDIDINSISSRNLAANALASMNSTTVSALPEQTSSSTISSQSTPLSQIDSSCGLFALLETPGQPSKYVRLSTTQAQDPKQVHVMLSTTQAKDPKSVMLNTTQAQNVKPVLLNTTQADVGEGVLNSPAKVQTASPPKKPKMSVIGNNVLVVDRSKIVPWRGIEGSVSVSDTCFYTDDRSVMEQCVQKYEEDTYSIFRCKKSNNTKISELKDVSNLDNHRVRWRPIIDQWNPADHVPDNVPYMVLRVERRMCRFSSNFQTSKSRRLKKKEWCVACNKTPEEQKSSTDVCTCRLRKTMNPIQKKPCPAVITIHTVIRFTDFRAVSRKSRVEMSQNLRYGLSLLEKYKMRIRQEKRIYVTVPGIEVHQNHPIFRIPKLDNPCCPCYRKGTCGKCQCKLTGCSGCNNNECRYRDAEGNFKPLKPISKKKRTVRKYKGSPYAAKSIRNIRLIPDELSLNEQLNKEAELETFQENSVVLKIQQEIMSMSFETARSTLLQMLEDDPIHVESYVCPDNTPYHRVQIDTPPKWCSCTQCVEMNHKSMKLCCGQKPCLTSNPMFRSVCLRPDHLLLGILDLGLPAESFSEFGNVSNAQYRRQAYRCFILWQWHNLGKGNVEVPKPPSCVVARIRWRYPSIDNHFGDSFSPDSDFEESSR